MELPKYIVMKVDCEPKSTTVMITDISDRCDVIEYEAEQTEPQRGCDADCNEDCTECAKEWQDWKDQMWAEAVEASKTEPQTESLEQFRVGLEYHTDTTHFGKVKGESVTTNKIEDEPQTNADQHAQHVESIETMSCQECKRWIYDDRWGWFCPLKSQDECRYEPKDEPQTEDEYITELIKKKCKGEPQTERSE